MTTRKSYPLSWENAYITNEYGVCKYPRFQKYCNFLRDAHGITKNTSLAAEVRKRYEKADDEDHRENWRKYRDWVCDKHPASYLLGPPCPAKAVEYQSDSDNQQDFVSDNDQQDFVSDNDQPPRRAALRTSRETRSSLSRPIVRETTRGTETTKKGPSDCNKNYKTEKACLKDSGCEWIKTIDDRQYCRTMSQFKREKLEREKLEREGLLPMSHPSPQTKASRTPAVSATLKDKLLTIMKNSSDPETQAKIRQLLRDKRTPDRTSSRYVRERQVVSDEETEDSRATRPVPKISSKPSDKTRKIQSILPVADDSTSEEDVSIAVNPVKFVKLANASRSNQPSSRRTMPVSQPLSDSDDEASGPAPAGVRPNLTSSRRPAPVSQPLSESDDETSGPAPAGVRPNLTSSRRTMPVAQPLSDSDDETSGPAPAGIRPNLTSSRRPAPVSQPFPESDSDDETSDPGPAGVRPNLTRTSRPIKKRDTQLSTKQIDLDELDQLLIVSDQSKPASRADMANSTRPNSEVSSTPVRQQQPSFRQQQQQPSVRQQQQQQPSVRRQQPQSVRQMLYSGDSNNVSNQNLDMESRDNDSDASSEYVSSLVNNNQVAERRDEDSEDLTTENSTQDKADM